MAKPVNVVTSLFKKYVVISEFWSPVATEQVPQILLVKWANLSMLQEINE